MKTNGWVGDAIDVVKMPDGTLITMDNTRLLAASRANIPVKANVHESTEILTDKLANRFKTKKAESLGHGAKLRIAESINKVVNIVIPIRMVHM